MITGGKSYVSSPPAFSNDAKRLLVCSGNSVSIFSTATGLQVASLEGHTGHVSTVIVVPRSNVLSYCWTASFDGTIRYWDFSVPELIKTIDIKFPIYSMVIPSLLSSKKAETSEEKSKLYAYVSIEDSERAESQSKSLHGQIRKCNLTNSQLVGGLTLLETKELECITVGASGKYFGIRNKRKLYIWNVPCPDSDRASVKKITLHHTKTITALAFHPTQRIVAAGDVTGRILIWRGYGNRTFEASNGLMNGRSINNDDEERPGVRGDDDAESCTTWHWHPSEVNTLAFSSDGAYLYSGGKEGVLVDWQLDTGKKKFLPRIGSPLLYYRDSPDPSLSSISCADNQIHILKMPSMEILKSISGIKLPCSFPELCKIVSSGIAFDQSNGLVALRTENYCIQLYSLFDDRGVSEVQICERNHQPGDEVTVIVASVALSPDGLLMSTAEVKLAEEGLGGLVSLKFWALGSDNRKFSLSTIVYEPHRDAEISSIAFHPTRCMAVSSSYGGDFKVWVCNNGSERKDQVLADSGWTCHAVASYKKKPMTAAAFSHDGSVLAVAAETVITLWDPENNILLAVIGETLTTVRTLSFLGKSDYLVSASWASKPQLAVWSMSKLSLHWSYRLHVEALASAPDSSSFAALVLLPELSKSNESKETIKARDGVILLFKAEDPVPVATWLVDKANGGGLAFLQSNQSFTRDMFDGNPPGALLAYVSGDHEYVLFDPDGKDLGKLKRDVALNVEESGKFGYTSIYGELPQLDLKSMQTPVVSSVPSDRPWDTIFSGSSHSLPPLTKLCSAFLESLLEKRTAFVE